MRRKLTLVVAGLLVVGGGAIASLVASSSATAATTLTVTEHYGRSTYVDLGKPGYSRGDLSTFHNTINDEADATRVGSDQGTCTVISTKRHSWECVFTVFVEGGDSSITIASPFYDLKDSVGAVTGGTGAYSGASGTIATSCSGADCKRGTYTLVFSLA